MIDSDRSKDWNCLVPAYVGRREIDRFMMRLSIGYPEVSGCFPALMSWQEM